MFYHFIYPLSETVSFLNVFRYITVRTAFAAITAFIITLLIGGLVIKLLKKAKIIQAVRKEGPKKHTITKKGVPTMGGIIIIIAFIVSTALWARFDSPYTYIILAAVIWFGLIGLADDLLKLKVGTKGLSAKAKLALQFIGGFGIVMMFMRLNADFTYLTYINIPFIKTPYELPVWIYVLFTALIIAGWSNAVNLTDGLDGLASGLTLFVFATFVVMAYIIGNVKISEYLLIMYVAESAELTVLCAAFVGAILGFLWFNSYPAQVFMGDVGALMLGGVIGTIAVLIKQEILMLIVGLIFVVEVFSVIVQVTSYKISRKRVFKMAPLHHHFQLKGVSEPKIIVRFWISAVIVLLFTLSTLKLR